MSPGQWVRLNFHCKSQINLHILFVLCYQKFDIGTDHLISLWGGPGFFLLTLEFFFTDKGKHDFFFLSAFKTIYFFSSTIETDFFITIEHYICIGFNTSFK